MSNTLLSGAGKVLAGDYLSTSHNYVFYEKMEFIKQNKGIEEDTEPMLRLFEGEGYQDHSYHFNMETTKLGDMIIRGKDLFEYNPSVAHAISQAYKEGKTILVNNKIVSKEEYDDCKLNPGGHVRVV